MVGRMAAQKAGRSVDLWAEHSAAMSVVHKEWM